MQVKSGFNGGNHYFVGRETNSDLMVETMTSFQETNDFFWGGACLRLQNLF